MIPVRARIRRTVPDGLGWKDVPPQLLLRRIFAAGNVLWNYSEKKRNSGKEAREPMGADAGKADAGAHLGAQNGAELPTGAGVRRMVFRGFFPAKRVK